MADHHSNSNNNDLDDLLDSALDDFQTLNLTNSSNQRSKELKEESLASPSSSSAAEVQGLGLGLGVGLPGLKAKKGKQKHKATTTPQQPNHVSEALDKLREQTKEAVKGLQSVTAAPDKPAVDDAMVEDWVKQFEDLAGSQDMESIMETMMQQLLSKEILHEPMKEIGERYPKWLEEHEASLSKEEFERFSNQHNLIKSLNQVYEKEPGNYNKIVELMQKMQECGQPPNDILNELAPDFDLSTLGQISPEMLESQDKCCVM